MRSIEIDHFLFQSSSLSILSTWTTSRYPRCLPRCLMDIIFVRFRNWTNRISLLWVMRTSTILVSIVLPDYRKLTKKLMLSLWLFWTILLKTSLASMELVVPYKFGAAILVIFNKLKCINPFLNFILFTKILYLPTSIIHIFAAFHNLSFTKLTITISKRYFDISYECGTCELKRVTRKTIKRYQRHPYFVILGGMKLFYMATYRISHIT